MNKSFPIRVNKKDADRHFHRKSFDKKPDADVKIFNQGARHYLHPSLSLLDRVDCELVYYKSPKVIVVSYDPQQESIDNTDYTRKAYKKCAMSSDVDFIVNTIREYIDDKKKETIDYLSSINSNVQSEPIDITAEENPV